MSNSIGSVHTLIEEKYGVSSRPVVNPITSNVAIVATRILTDNPRRLSVLIMNTGANPVYIGLDNSVSSTRGIYLAAGGGAISLMWRDDFENQCHERWAIAVGGVSTIYVEENVIL